MNLRNSGESLEVFLEVFPELLCGAHAMCEMDPHTQRIITTATPAGSSFSTTTTTTATLTGVHSNCSSASAPPPRPAQPPPPRAPRTQETEAKISSLRFWRRIFRRSFSSARTRSSFITTVTGSKYDRVASESSTRPCRLAKDAKRVEQLYAQCWSGGAIACCRAC